MDSCNEMEHLIENNVVFDIIVKMKNIFQNRRLLTTLVRRNTRDTTKKRKEKKENV